MERARTRLSYFPDGIGEEPTDAPGSGLAKELGSVVGPNDGTGVGSSSIEGKGDRTVVSMGIGSGVPSGSVETTKDWLNLRIAC